MVKLVLAALLDVADLIGSLLPAFVALVILLAVGFAGWQAWMNQFTVGMQ